MSVPSVPSVSLSEVLQLALPPGSRVLVGHDRLTLRVHWARMLGARPTSLGIVEPGELLLLPPALLDSLGEPRVLPRLIEDLVEAGVTAFVVSAEPHQAVLEACEASGTPLFEVPDGTPLIDVERATIGLILDRDGQLRRRAEDVYGQLLATMLGNAGLSALVAALADATGLRVAVFDDYLTIQSCAPDDEPFKQGLSAAANRAFLRDSSAGSARLGRRGLVRFRQGDSLWVGQFYPLQIGAAWAGYLGLVAHGGEAGDLERLLAERAATLVALEMAKQRAVAEATQRWHGELLDDLLQGNFPTDEALLARGRQLGYDLLGRQVSFVVGIDRPSEASAMADGAQDANRQRRRFAEVARTLLLRLHPRALTIERDGTLVALLPIPPSAEPDASWQLVEQVRAAIAEALPDIGISAGLGRSVTRPSEVGPSQREAVEALALAQKLLGGERTIDYGRLGIERLLILLLDNPALERFGFEVLGKLLTYDEVHHSDLVRTLEVFLSCNGNHVRAAQKLHLHRNTLLYRLERAREILGRDLEDAETRLTLQVALRIRGALGKALPDAARTSRRVASRGRRVG
jgi:PucR family transcriptional regulator, purine catabolism regulatory protein